MCGYSDIHFLRLVPIQEVQHIGLNDWLAQMEVDDFSVIYILYHYCPVNS